MWTVVEDRYAVTVNGNLPAKTATAVRFVLMINITLVVKIAKDP